jgi:type III secretory pathway component EscV
MNKRIRTLAEIGAVYVAASIVVEALLNGYPILILPILSIIFIVFAIMIFQVLWESRIPNVAVKRPTTAGRNDDLSRLEHLCDLALNQADANAEKLLSDRIRRLAFASASCRLNTPIETLRSLAEQEANPLSPLVGDQQISDLLTSKKPFIHMGNSRDIDQYMTKIEDWMG